MTGIVAVPLQDRERGADADKRRDVANAATPRIEVILDLSRLLSRVLHPTPTGVDRVEMAYARGLIRTIPDRLRFAAVQPSGVYGRLPTAAVRRFLDATEHGWREDGHAGSWRHRWWAARALGSLMPRPVPRRPRGWQRVYVQASPHHLENRGRVARILAREEARFICMVHDLIPIEFPEYARPGGAEAHRRRVETVVRHADAIVTNSAATRDALTPFLAAAGRTPLIRVAHLGFDDEAMPDAPLSPPAADARPYFVCVGTIEPRKNHLLLLNIWRRMVAQGEPRMPRLVLIGRRGWENEQVVDMLDRCPALEGHVEEHGRLPDREVLRLVAGACALLLPSFAEGYGMPVMEARALGTPVICSDLPALREAGGALTTYLDPLDGGAWLTAIRDAAAAPRRAPGRSPAARNLPGWEPHIATLNDLVQRVAA